MLNVNKVVVYPYREYLLQLVGGESGASYLREHLARGGAGAAAVAAGGAQLLRPAAH